MRAWITAQIGAREHYAIPRALHQMAKLQCHYTDIWASPAVRWCAQRSPLRRVRSLAGRWHQELASAAAVSWPISGLIRSSLQSRYQTEFDFHIAYGRWFSAAVGRHLARDTFVQPGSVFFSYDTGALEAFKVLKDRGVKCVLGQMDAHRLYRSLVEEERDLWPEWEPAGEKVPEAYHQRREEEWSLADMIVVNSEFSARALEASGLARSRISIVPLSFEVSCEKRRFDDARGRDRDRPLRVLFAARVSLAKGIQYLVEAARLLSNEPVEFHVVGQVMINPAVVCRMPNNIHFHGLVTRGEVQRWYQACDVLAFPTIADGFGLTQLEAMAHGLPVISTPNCADVVIDGVNGVRVPMRDGQGLAAAIKRFIGDRDFHASCSENAVRRAGEFKQVNLQQSLLSIEASLFN